MSIAFKYYELGTFLFPADLKSLPSHLKKCASLIADWQAAGEREKVLKDWKEKSGCVDILTKLTFDKALCLIQHGNGLDNV